MRGREKLVGFLCDRGILTSPSLERAFLDVDLEAFLPREFRPLAYANAPTPFSTRFRGAVLPSPMALAALLQLLEVSPGLDVGIVGAGGGYPAALVARATETGRVTVAEADASLRDDATENLRRAGLADRVTVSDDLGGGPFHRILVLDVGQRPLRDLTPRLANLGFAIARGCPPDALGFRKRVRSGGEELELTITDMPTGSRSPGESRAATWARLLTRDDLVEHAWEGRVVGHHDAHFCQGIDETFAGGPLDARLHELSTPALVARRAFHVAYILQCLGELEDAADLYERSIASVPTAEGHTFLGWVHSFTGDLHRAIEECKRAIETDPTFGNPYNDIGAYLIDLERPDEAIPWLRKALVSERYCCYFYAHTNLGRAYVLIGQSRLARRHFEEALKLNPNYAPALEMLRRVGRETDYAR